MSACDKVPDGHRCLNQGEHFVDDQAAQFAISRLAQLIRYTNVTDVWPLE